MSEVKVNKISPRTNCGTVTLGDSGDSFAVATSASFKTKEVKDASGNIIISRCGSNITIGSSGAAVALAAGATQSGFGASGAVNWDTTPKTTTVTAVSGNGYFINTTSSGVTVNLPAGSAGAIVALSDYAATWNTNAVTVNANETEKIGGVNAPATLSTQGQAVTFVYVDSTQGWINVGDATKVTGNPYIVATGGTVTTCGNYKIHTFTGPGTFTVTQAPPSNNIVDYLIVAGGGGGGGQQPGDGGGGAGAGGFRSSITTVPTGAPPLSNPVAMPVSATAYPITVGAGGTGGVACCTSPTLTAANGTPGNNSIFNTITSSGGGAGEGANRACSPAAVGRGGSGGGAHQGWACQPYPSTVGFPGNFPSVSPPQGNAGGDGGATPNAGGGGGAGATGGVAPGPGGSGPGGDGSYVPDSWIGPTAPSYGTPGPVASTRYFAGGGGGGGSPSRGSQTGSTGGAGGGGAGGSAGTVNTGGGGGAGQPSPSNAGKTGGSGIVIIRYQYQ